MLRIGQLSKHHDREGFDCGVPALNDYLRRTARQLMPMEKVRAAVAMMGKP